MQALSLNQLIETGVRKGRCFYCRHEVQTLTTPSCSQKATLAWPLREALPQLAPC